MPYDPGAAWLDLRAFWNGLPAFAHILAIAAGAVGVHLLVRALHGAVDRLLAPAASGAAAREQALRAAPKLATVASLLASTVTLVVLFFAIGLILREFGLRLGEYLVTATVIGLAVGFGSQGLVQDIVIGLTLIFTDAMDVGDTVEIAGQTGRVDRMGLRFTVLTNFLGQNVYVPNRNIGTVGRFRRGVIRAYVDVHVSEGIDAERLGEVVRSTASGFRQQFSAIILSEPELGALRTAGDGPPYVRIKLRLWPGQGALVETAFRQRLLARLKQLDPEYADWMVTVTYRAGSGSASSGTAAAPGASR